MFLLEFEKIVSRFSATMGIAVNNLSATGRTKKQCISIAADIVLATVSLWLAYTLRYGEMFTNFRPNWHFFLLLPVITVIILASLGVYKWVIRSSTERLTSSLIKGGLASALVLLMLMFLLPPEGTSVPRTLLPIYCILFTCSAIISRQLWRGLFGVNNLTRLGERVAIYGAGRAGQQLVQLMKLDESKNPVLFIDDNRALNGSMLAGLPVIGSDIAKVLQQIRNRDISRIILAIPSVTGKRYAGVVNKLSLLDVPVQTIPSVSEIMSGRASADQIRDISVDDLLGRSVVEPNTELMQNRVTGKVVLVTGGGGSIGSEICRQVIMLRPQKLIVLDQGEENLYRITEEMRTQLEHYSHGIFLPVLGSVTNQAKLAALFSENQIDTVYHAAAYKHVPIIEDYPEEGIGVNVMGTWNVLDCAIKHKVETFTLVSTDKAVRPANNMGATKRIAEMVLQAKAKEEHDTIICMVRFGNVLGSSGSVVPKFQQQISEGGPVTLTHRGITRYFMTIPEASQLVLQASSLAKGGEVFVLDMGEPVRVYDLAASMIKLAGRQVKNGHDSDDLDAIEIVEIGLRPGEKMYEELFVSDSAMNTAVARIFVALDELELPEEMQTLMDPDISPIDLRQIIEIMVKKLQSSHTEDASSRGAGVAAKVATRVVPSQEAHRLSV